MFLKYKLKPNLYSRQISNNKVNNFTVTLPAPQSDLANYLLKDPYIFDLAGAKEKADERDIEEQLVKHVTRYLLEMGNGFAFVARQKHFQVGNSDFFADLILSFNPPARIHRSGIESNPIQTGVCRATELLHQCGGRQTEGRE